MIDEGVILLRVEHFEHRRRRVAPEVRAHLVDLIEQDHRVHRARLLDRVDDPAGERADIGAPVPANVRLVTHAAERDAHEGPIHRAGDRTPERGLADAGRPDEAEDRRHVPRHAALRHQLAHGEEIEDALLDVLEAVVILIEHLLRDLQIEAVGRPLRPGQPSTQSR